MQHEKWMEQALVQAQGAYDAGEFPVGCVIVHDGEIVATGSRQGSVGNGELDHAEIVALRSLGARLQAGEFLAKDLTVYSTMEPCLMCYSTMVVNGIRNIVYAYEDAMGGGTELLLSSLPPLYQNIEMNVKAGVLRPKALRLFQEFFKRPDSYLADSFLAEYTLSQKIDVI